MSRIHLTPEIMERLYDLLKVTKPYRSWKLPEADDVVFVVTRHPVEFGEYVFDNGQHFLKMSSRKHKTLHSAMLTMAHEMCHIRDYLLGTPWNIKHGASFQRLAKQACAEHGWDQGAF